MAEHDRNDARNRRGEAEWFLDFEQDAPDIEVMAKAAGHRRRQTKSPERKQPNTGSNATGPSLWVTEFLLNQVEGAGKGPRVVPRKPSPAKATQRDGPKPTMERKASGYRGAKEASASADSAPDPRGVPTPARPSAAAPSPLPAAVQANAGDTGHRSRAYALSGLVAVGLATGLFALPSADWQAVPADEGDKRPVQAATEPRQLLARPSSNAVWLDLPVRAAPTLRPDRTVTMEPASASTARADDEPIEEAAAVHVPTVETSASAPNSVAALLPSNVAWIAPAPASTGRLGRPSIEITARDVDEERGVATASDSRNTSPGMQANVRVNQKPKATAVDRSAREDFPRSENGRGVGQPRGPSGAARRDAGRRNDTRRTPSRLAQAAQPRTFTLPGILRPTPF